MPVDKRIYTRYEVKIEARIGLESGITLPAEVLDISIEGVKLKIEGAHLSNLT